MIEGGDLPRRALLGAELPGDLEAFAEGGVRIAAVEDGGMAEAAGVCGGDVLVALAGLPVRDLDELAAALRAAGASATAELAYVRDGARLVGRAAVVRRPCEAGARYGALDTGGARLRTIANIVAAPRAVILVVQGIACESIEGLAPLAERWAAAEYASLRFDKRGVGDSEGGPCHGVDFATEVADARLALAHARALAPGRPLVVFGHSVGALIATQLVADGVIVYGAPATRWLDCLRGSTRRQLALRGATPAEIAERVAVLDQLRTRGELNGRSATYHAQLDGLDVDAAWRDVRAPVLVIHGEHDWVVGEPDRIAAATAGTVIVAPGLDHLFARHADRDASLRDYGEGDPDPGVAEIAIDWLDRATLGTC